MPDIVANLPPQVNHVFVDYENVHEINLAIIGSKAVTFTLLVGPRQTKLDVSLVEKLFEHAASVQLVRLTSAGPNALDFALVYYVGHAVAADPAGYFHIVSKDTGYDPLIDYLRNKHIKVRRHDSFATLTFASPVKPATPAPPAAAPKLKPQSKSKARSAILGEWESRVLEHWRKPSATRPKNKEKLVNFLVKHLGNTTTAAQASDLIEYLSRAGHLTIGEKGKVTFFVKQK